MMLSYHLATEASFWSLVMRGHLTEVGPSSSRRIGDRELLHSTVINPGVGEIQDRKKLGGYAKMKFHLHWSCVVWESLECQLCPALFQPTADTSQSWLLHWWSCAGIPMKLSGFARMCCLVHFLSLAVSRCSSNIKNEVQILCNSRFDIKWLLKFGYWLIILFLLEKPIDVLLSYWTTK